MINMNLLNLYSREVIALDSEQFDSDIYSFER